MTDREARFHEIDNLVEDSGHNYNPLTDQFEADIGSDSENNLDHDSESFLDMLPGVSKVEFNRYITWKADLAKQSYYQELGDEMIEEREKSGDGNP